MTVASVPSAHDQARQRFDDHRRAFAANGPLRTLYGRWYRRVAGKLPPATQGRRIELGSGPGLARRFVPDLELSDVVAAPWLDHRIDAQALPFRDASLGALVAFDVVHHLPRPARLLAEAERVLVPGGRLVMCEPCVSAASWPVYRFLHDEALDSSVDPFDAAGVDGRDPFAGNQAVPTLLFERRRADVERRFPGLRVVSVDRLAGPSYPASGGFTRRPLLPGPLWRALLAVEDALPDAAFRLLGFRLLAVIERR